ncbi:MAG: NAD(P)/FAD-dependent oxidoreductase [Gammaproteobacteria bacterium]|nr:NAD(P)/FAD-dependent oxidoreductase [Gammaproteobacteria bacterium]
MQKENLDCDYLIIGSGAVGMAFADTLLAETDANIIIVDKHSKPGGHWNDAYPFVTLHQPSAFYGVNSRQLGDGSKDKSGLNKGLYGLATGQEILDYYSTVMHEQFLPSGRVQYFPDCEYLGNGYIRSLHGEQDYQVTINKKTVDGTYFQTSVPSTHTPKFDVDPDVPFTPINALPKLVNDYSDFVVIGAGKTGMDAIVWLLQNKISPDNIRWVMPRDSWLINRETTQPGMEFFKQAIGSQADQMQALAEAESIEDLFVRLERSRALLRIDKSIQPKMFHGATTSPLELTELQKIKNIIRLGRVTRIEKDQIVLEQGSVASNLKTLHIDCSASAVPPREILPVFQDDLITVQTIRTVQPVFSAAFIAHIEATYTSDEEKNKICSVVPLPNHYTDWIKVTSANMKNQYIWSKHPGIREWLIAHRLDGFMRMVQSVKKYNIPKMLVLKRLRDNAKPAVAKMQKFLHELES